MKKLLMGVFCLFALCALASCGETEKEYTLGMGVVVELAEGKVEFNATVATVVLEEGKIVACRLDAVQNKADVNTADGTFTVKNLKTKMEQGDAYGMTAALGYHMDWNNDGVVKEWYDQAKAFEAYVVGKTAAEVKAMGTKEVTTAQGEIYKISNDDALLAAGCTIQITDFKEAVAKACEDEFAVTFKTAAEFTLGVAAESTVDTVKSVNGQLHIGSEFAASVVVDGKIVASLNDAIQPSYTIKDAITPAEFKGTKRELKEEYGMNPAVNWGMDWNNDGVTKEWYLQSAEFSKYVVGKTAAEVLAMGTKEVTSPKGEIYKISNEDALLAAGCTIQITSIKTVVAESVTNAR
jgi:hypothetical protein